MWLVDMGGWENDDTPALFARFVRRVVAALKDYVSLWTTVNEPNVYTLSGWVEGVFPPGKRDMRLAAKVLVNLIRGHAAAYRVIHELQPHALAGVATNYRGFASAHTWNPLDKIPIRAQNQIFNRAFNDCLASGKLNLVLKRVSLPDAAGTQDFIGLNYYTRDMVAFDLLKPSQMFGRRFFRLAQRSALAVSSPMCLPVCGTG